MNIYLMYTIIVLLTMLLFIVIKDKKKVLKITGIITISSSLLVITLLLIMKIIINNYITAINLSTITNYLFKEFLETNILLFIIGLIEILISKYLNNRKIIHQ